MVDIFNYPENVQLLSVSGGFSLQGSLTIGSDGNKYFGMSKGNCNVSVDIFGAS